jgi:hypothetical protein
MRANLFRLLQTLLLLGALGLTPGTSGQETVQWLESYEAALEEARRTGKPIFLEYRCSP